VPEAPGLKINSKSVLRIASKSPGKCIEGEFKYARSDVLKVCGGSWSVHIHAFSVAHGAPAGLPLLAVCSSCALPAVCLGLCAFDWLFVPGR
jgi:hypothetical protein